MTKTDNLPCPEYLIDLACNAGIDCRKMTIGELHTKYDETMKNLDFADQHDMRLGSALENLKETN